MCSMSCRRRKRRLFHFSRRPSESHTSPLVSFMTTSSMDGWVGLDALRHRNLGREAVLRTNHGDITFKLFGAECPKTVENFCTHARNGYYDGTVFHRVIKGFMVQCGDPLGDGTGGESIWGGEFEDEFSRSLRHDRAFTVSMANAGPNTNGSQFFITTVPTPWLDNKHTVSPSRLLSLLCSYSLSLAIGVWTRDERIRSCHEPREPQGEQGGPACGRRSQNTFD